MIAEYGISGYDPSTGLTGILPYLFRRKADAYSKIEKLNESGGYGLRIVEYTWEELYRTPPEKQSKEVSQLKRILLEELNKVAPISPMRETPINWDLSNELEN